MPTVTFGEDSKVAVLVLGELRIECLQKLPDKWGRCDGGCDLVIAVGETGADWLVDIEHVCKRVEGVRVQRGSRLAIDEVTWPIFLEQTDHA